MTHTTYSVYEAVSPSGKKYIGMTKTSIEKRWYAHVRLARIDSGRHPLRDAIRKYGGDAFTLRCLAEYDNVPDAATAEHLAIWMEGTLDRARGYNLSEGFDYDAVAGAAGLRKKLEDPVWRADYLAKLSAGIRTGKVRDDWEPTRAAAREWRRAHAKQAYQSSRRAVRIAATSQGRLWTGGPGEVKGSFGRLWIPGEAVLRARRQYLYRKKAVAQWAARSPDDVADVSAKISVALSEHHKGPGKDARNAQIAQARASIDRKVQGAAASAGLKAWWAEIKKDPVAYKELMDGKRAKLRARRKNV